MNVPFLLHTKELCKFWLLDVNEYRVRVLAVKTWREELEDEETDGNDKEEEEEEEEEEYLLSWLWIGRERGKPATRQSR